jgi:nucleoside permease NupC
MPSGNGARAQQKRERNAKKQGNASAPKSQLKVNEAAKTIVCKVCLTSFMSVSSKKMLAEHAENKHPKSTFAVRIIIIIIFLSDLIQNLFYCL